MADTQSSSESGLAAAEELEKLAEQLTSAATAIRERPSCPATLKNETSKALTSMEQLSQSMKHPLEQIMDMMVVLVKFVSLRLYIKWGLFAKIPQTGSASYADLAGGIGAETALVARFGAALVSTGVLAETGPGHVSHTSNSLVYATKGPMSALICVGYDGHLKTLAVLLKYFDEFGLREPIGKTGTVFAYACGDATKSVWDHCNSDQEYKENFMLCMVAMASKTPTAGSYDYSWVTAKGETEPSRTLVVDVGGGHGHALRDIATATPGLSLGRCAVEDLAPVVEEAKRTAAGGLEKAQFVTMDFHAEQPIKEAVVYYIRRCLHDYGDDDCVDILSQIAGAMAKDSRLLIVEQVLREPLAAVPVANDIIMALIGGKERTEEGFRAIAGRAGLEIAGVHRSEGTEFAVVECKLV